MLRTLKEIWQFREMIWVLVGRELRIRYKRTFLGFFWSLISPFSQAIVLVVVVEKILGVDVKDHSAYILCGIFAWQYFNATILDGCSVLLYHMPLLKAFSFPREILPLSTVLSNLIHFGMSLLVLFFYLLILKVRLRAEALLLPVLIIGQTLLTAGLVFILSYLCVYFQDVKFIVDSLGLRLLFFAVPIFYFAERVPEEWFCWYMLNPLAVYITFYKKILLYPPVLPDLKPLKENLPWEALIPYLLLALALSGAIFVVGLLLFQRHKWKVAEWL